MITEEFAEGSSWVHTLDTRIKIIITVLLASVTALGNDWAMLLQVLAFVFILTLTTGLSLKRIAKRLLVVNTFIFFIWLMLPFTFPGETIFNLGPFSASREGIIYSAKITLRSNTVILLVISLLGTSTVSDLIRGMKKLYIPDKIIYLMFFIYRYAHVIKEEYKKLKEAMLLRGFKRNFSLHCYTSYAYLIGMLIVKSYDRSQKVLEAMLCRGFKGEYYLMEDKQLTSRDISVLVVSLFVMVWLISWEKSWGLIL